MLNPQMAPPQNPLIFKKRLINTANQKAKTLVKT